MSNLSLTEEMNIIESIVVEFNDGIGISDIETVLNQKQVVINRRTLQRRLKKLIQEQRINSKGDSISLIYKPVSPSTLALSGTSSATSTATASVEFYIPVSAEGASIRALVQKPLMYRHPTSYQFDFLADYQPNETYYLPESLRKQLHQMGRTSMSQRPAGTYARDIVDRLLVDLSWASSRLEGNTYSRLDTQNLIQFGQVAQGKDAIETQMILNHKSAIEMLIENADEVGFDAFTFKNLHAVLSQELMRDPSLSGRLRTCRVDISGTVYHPIALPQVIEDCFLQLLSKAGEIVDPFEQAFFLMVQLPYLQPFEDVNKRVSRIGANIPLIKQNLCPLSFIDVPENAYIEGILGVYELNRIELLRDVFVWAYERSCQRYLAITQTMIAPHPLKIKYREQLIKAVQAIVQTLRPINDVTIHEQASQYADTAEVDIFAQLLTESLTHLHEGSIARYRLRQSEYVAWRRFLEKDTINCG